MRQNVTQENTPNRLFVIEAPGKISSFRSLLGKIGIEATVVATRGHLYSYPSDLSELGVDTKFNEAQRKSQNDVAIKFIRDAARKVETIYITTDADNEGDVIAWDLHELLKDICPDIYRVKLKGMDEESVRESIDNVTAVRKSDAIPGRTRAMVDRMIGSTFSGDGKGVGRVLTALLGTVKNGDLSPLKIRLSAPAKDGGTPWIASFPLKAPINEDIANKLVNLQFPALDMKASKEFSSKPMHMGDIMSKASDVLGMTPTETASSLQNLYESGQMSYPRSGSRGVSKGAQRRLKRMMKKSGFKGDADNIREKDTNEVHDAPYPTTDVDVSKDPRKLGDDKGVQNIVAREIIKSSQKREKQAAHTKQIFDFLVSRGFSKEVSTFVAKLGWTREIGPAYPGQEKWAKSSIEERMPEAVLLESAVDIGLGKPSTWAKHIDGRFERGLVDDNLDLTQKGREWADHAPDELLDPRISSAIEKPAIEYLLE